MRRRPLGILLAAAAIILVSIAGPASAQSVKRGEHVFRKCRLCHVTDPEAKDLLAPPLHNIVGRRAAIIKGFPYSKTMQEAGKQGLSWTAEALYAFLDRPDEFIPGTFMAFAGLEDQERRDVIAYLQSITAEFKRNQERKAADRPSPPPSGSSAGSPAKGRETPRAGQPAESPRGN